MYRYMNKFYCKYLILNKVYCIGTWINWKGSIYVSIDKTTDVDGRYVTNVIVGLLQENKCSKSYLFTWEELLKWNYQTVGKLINDALNILWPFGIKYKTKSCFIFNRSCAIYGENSQLTYCFISKHNKCDLCSPWTT